MQYVGTNTKSKRIKGQPGGRWLVNAHYCQEIFTSLKASAGKWPLCRNELGSFIQRINGFEDKFITGVYQNRNIVQANFPVINFFVEVGYELRQ